MDDPAWRVNGRNGSEIQRSAEPLRYEDIVLPNLDAAYSLARWLVRDPDLAEDVVQDSVARGLTYFTSFRGGNAKAWLMRIVRNTAYTSLAALRKEGRAEPYDSASEETIQAVPDPGLNPEQALLKKERARQVDEALLALPAELRECLILKEIEELSYKEIAQVTSVPIGTVMSRLWRARQALMHLVKPGDGHDA